MQDTPNKPNRAFTSSKSLTYLDFTEANINGFKNAIIQGIEYQSQRTLFSSIKGQRSVVCATHQLVPYHVGIAIYDTTVKTFRHFNTPRTESQYISQKDDTFKGSSWRLISQPISVNASFGDENIEPFKYSTRAISDPNLKKPRSRAHAASTLLQLSLRAVSWRRESRQL